MDEENWARGELINYLLRATTILTYTYSRTHTHTHTYSHTHIHTYIHTRTLTRLRMISYNGQINNSSLANHEFIASRRCIFTSRFQQSSVDMHICNAYVSSEYIYIMHLSLYSIGMYLPLINTNISTLHFHFSISTGLYICNASVSF